MHPSSPHDPEHLADDLLDEVKRARASAKSPVFFLLRSPELLALPPALQAQVLVHARRGALADPKTILAFLLWGAALISLLFVAAPRLEALLAGLGWIPAFAAHTLRVRRRARRLARDLAVAGIHQD